MEGNCRGPRMEKEVGELVVSVQGVGNADAKGGSGGEKDEGLGCGDEVEGRCKKSGTGCKRKKTTV